MSDSNRELKEKRARGRVAVVTHEDTDLTPLEEKVIRMRRGSFLPGQFALRSSYENLPDSIQKNVMQQLRALEVEALKESGRLVQLKAEVAEEEQELEALEEIKSKIVGHFKGS